MDKIELGSVVSLNSGSPPMTVEYFREGGEAVDVVWLHEGKIQRGWFKPESLRPHVEQAAQGIIKCVTYYY